MTTMKICLIWIPNQISICDKLPTRRKRRMWSLQFQQLRAAVRYRISKQNIQSLWRFQKWTLRKSMILDWLQGRAKESYFCATRAGLTDMAIRFLALVYETRVKVNHLERKFINPKHINMQGIKSKARYSSDSNSEHLKGGGRVQGRWGLSETQTFVWQWWCPSLLSATVITMTKINLEKKRFVWITCLHHNPS